MSKGTLSNIQIVGICVAVPKKCEDLSPYEYIFGSDTVNQFSKTGFRVGLSCGAMNIFVKKNIAISLSETDNFFNDEVIKQ